MPGNACCKRTKKRETRDAARPSPSTAPHRAPHAEPRGGPVHRPDALRWPGLSLPWRLEQEGQQPPHRNGSAARQPHRTRRLGPPTSPPHCKGWRPPPTPPVSRSYQANLRTYQLLRYGVPVQIAAGQAHETVHLIDWAHPEKNDFALAEEVKLKGGYERRPDIVLYLNGLAIAVIELKRSSVEVADGVRQLNTNQEEMERIGHAIGLLVEQCLQECIRAPHLSRERVRCRAQFQADSGPAGVATARVGAKPTQRTSTLGAGCPLAGAKGYHQRRCAPQGRASTHQSSRPLPGC